VSVRPEFAPYQIFLGKAFQKQFDQLSDSSIRRVATALEKLALEGRGDIKNVGDDLPGAFRLRVGGLRIFFDVQGDSIFVRVLEKRGEAYKGRSRR
jgi:mRNA-degrading endonuclease RelE of RelBE toxin-antitoxin system